MWVSVISIDRTLPMFVDGLGSDLAVTATVGVGTVLLVAALYVGVQRTFGVTDRITPVNPGTSATPDQDAVPDESEWTVSYNPPSRRSSKRNPRSGNTGSGSTDSSPSTSQAGGSDAGAASASGGSAGSSGSSARSTGDGRSSTGAATGSKDGASADGSGASADGAGQTRLYDPTEDPAGTDTRIFTGEKRDPATCPDCEESLPTGSDFEFCPFCGYEL